MKVRGFSFAGNFALLCQVKVYRENNSLQNTQIMKKTGVNITGKKILGKVLTAQLTCSSWEFPVNLSLLAVATCKKKLIKVIVF